MDGSRTIRVLKRDGSEEGFDRLKLASAMWRSMRRTDGKYRDALELATAVEMFLDRRGRRRVASNVLFEMALKVLRRCRLTLAAGAMERHRWRRQKARAALRLRHGGGEVTEWEKAWLAEWARRSWLLTRTTARILAAEVEAELLAARRGQVDRLEVLDMLDRHVAAYGLADAVPAGLAAG